MKEGFYFLIEGMKADGTCCHVPYYLRAGPFEEAQECGPFTLSPYEAYHTQDKARAENVAEACNILFPLQNGARWQPTEHGFH